MIDSGRQSLSDGQYGHKRREIRKEISTLSIFFFGGGYNVNFVSYVHVCIGACQCLQVFHQIFITLLTFRWPKQSSDEHFRKTSGYFFPDNTVLFPELMIILSVIVCKMVSGTENYIIVHVEIL